MNIPLWFLVSNTWIPLQYKHWQAAGIPLCLSSVKSNLRQHSVQNRPSCEFMIVPLDWPWLTGTANAQKLDTTQPVLSLFTQNMQSRFCFFVFFHILTFTRIMCRTMLPPAEVRLDQPSGVTASSDCEIYVRTHGNVLLNKQKTHTCTQNLYLNGVTRIIKWCIVCFLVDFSVLKASLWPTLTAAAAAAWGDFYDSVCVISSHL